jgi:hypothetical protein
VHFAKVSNDDYTLLNHILYYCLATDLYYFHEKDTISVQKNKTWVTEICRSPWLVVFQYSRFQHINMSSTGQPYRLAILECDDPLDETRRKLGGHTACFKQIFTETVVSFNQPLRSFVDNLELTSWDVVYAQKYPELDSVDAILVSGSRFSSYEDNEWVPKLVAFVSEALKKPEMPVIGVCFGHQIIARCLGGTVARNPLGWEISVSKVSLTEHGQKLFGTGKQSLVS